MRSLTIDQSQLSLSKAEVEAKEPTAVVVALALVAAPVTVIKVARNGSKQLPLLCWLVPSKPGTVVMSPGGLTGPKGRRIVTAAISAAGIDALLDKNTDGKSKRHIVKSIIGGLVINRLVNGPRNRSYSRVRSHSRDSYVHPHSLSRYHLRSLSHGLVNSQSRRGGWPQRSRDTGWYYSSLQGLLRSCSLQVSRSQPLSIK